MQALTFFKALSDPTRLKLIHLLRDNQPICVCDLTASLQQPQPTVSRHLNHLRRVGILTCEKRGTWIWYQMNQKLPQWCKQIIATIEMDVTELSTVDSIV